MSQLYTYWPKVEALGDLKPEFGEQIAVSDASLLSGVVAALMDNNEGASMEVTVTSQSSGFTVTARALGFDEISMPGMLYNVLDLDRSGQSLAAGSTIVFTAIVDGSFWLPSGGRLPHVQFDYEERKQLLESIYFAYKDESQTRN